jgi:hypothetical protein
MKRKNLRAILLLLLLIVIANINIFAQEKNLWPVRAVIINGISDEWPHPIANYNKDTKLHFAVANDATNLYILIESADQPTNAKILANSITVSINPKGKKKVLTSLTFPIIERQEFFNRPPFRANKDEKPGTIGSDNPQIDILSKANTIKINGFYKIPDGTFSSDLVSAYGIRTSAKFDKNRVFIYEMSIPLSKLNISLNQRKAVAYNVKINGSSNFSNDFSESGYPGVSRRPGSGGGVPTGGRIPTTGGIPGLGVPTRGRIPTTGRIPNINGGGTAGRMPRGGSGQRPSSDNSKRFKAVDFWVKYRLAKTKL